MPPLVDPTSCEFLDERLDAYFDGELGELERVRVERHAATCAPCAETLAAYSALRNDLRADFPLEACPEEITAAVLEQARREAREAAPRAPWLERVHGFLTALLPTPQWRPVLVGVAAGILLAVPLWRTLRGPAPSAAVASAELTPEELAKAEQEARMVLALVASIGENAGSKVRDEILTNRIVQPTRRAFGFPAEPADTMER